MTDLPEKLAFTAIGAVIGAGAFGAYKTTHQANDVSRHRLEGAATFRYRCENHKDFPSEARAIMQYEMDRLLNNMKEDRGR